MNYKTKTTTRVFWPPLWLFDLCNFFYFVFDFEFFI